MKKTINKIIKFIKRLLLFLAICAIVYGAYLVTQYVNGQTVVVENGNIPQVAVKQDITSDTDKAIQEAQAKIDAERTQLLADIADLQAKQEVKVARLKALESVNFQKESN